MSSNLIKHVLPSALVVCKNKSYHRYHLGLCQQPILPIPFYLSSPLCLTCLSFPSSMLFLCLTCSRRLFVPKCQEGKAVIYWKILLDSWPAVWNVRAELFTVKEEEEKRILSLPSPGCDCITSRGLCCLPPYLILSFSRDWEHQLLTFMWEAALWKQKEIKLFWPSCSSPGQQLFL